jgi:hypothetical protein
MRKLVGAVVMLALAAGTGALGRTDETVEQLVARAKAERLDQQPEIYMEAAQLELKAATDAYKADKGDEFLAAVQQIVKYSDSAHAAAIHTGKHLKDTEIKIRELSLRLRDIKLNVDMDEQPPVQAAIDRLEGFRTELLQGMFGTKKQDKKP